MNAVPMILRCGARQQGPDPGPGIYGNPERDQGTYVPPTDHGREDAVPLAYDGTGGWA